MLSCSVECWVFTQRTSTICRCPSICILITMTSACSSSASWCQFLLHFDGDITAAKGSDATLDGLDLSRVGFHTSIQVICPMYSLEECSELDYLRNRRHTMPVEERECIKLVFNNHALLERFCDCYPTTLRLLLHQHRHVQLCARDRGRWVFVSGGNRPDHLHV